MFMNKEHEQQKHFAKRVRSRRGYALVTVMMISLMASVLLMSLAGLSIGLLQTEGAARQRSYALAGAEAGLDFARARLKESLISDVPTDIAPDGEQSFVDTAVPVHYLPQLGNSCRVMVRVTRVTSDEMVWAIENHSSTIPSSLNPSDENNKPQSRKSESDWRFGDDWQLFTVPNAEEAPNKSYAWKVEVTSYCGLFAVSIRSILVGFNSTAAIPPDTNASNPPGIVANDLIFVDTGGGDATRVSTNVDDPSNPTLQVGPEGSNNTFLANLKSNSYISMGAAIVDGNLIGSNPSSSESAFLTGTSSTLINGRVETNANEVAATDGLQGAETEEGVAQNVFAKADLAPYGTSPDPLGKNTTPVTSGGDLLFPQSPLPVPVPSNASPLPSFPTVPAATDPNEPVPAPPPVPPIPAGSVLYSEGLDSSNASGPLIFEKDDGNSGATKIFVKDPTFYDASSPEDFAIDLNSSFFQNIGDPDGVQIFYAGNRKVRLTIDPSMEMKLTLFAPLAVVTVGSSGSSTSSLGVFSGGIVGRSVKISGLSEVRLDRKSALTLSERLKNRNLNNPDENSYAIKPNDFKVMTWEQINGKIVPLF